MDFKLEEDESYNDSAFGKPLDDSYDDKLPEESKEMQPSIVTEKEPSKASGSISDYKHLQ
jgi:hypothetical protein